VGKKGIYKWRGRTYSQLDLSLRSRIVYNGRLWLLRLSRLPNRPTMFFFPLPDPTFSPPKCTNTWTPFLYGRVQLAYFRLEATGNGKTYNQTDVAILDKEGRMAGRLNSDQHHESQYYSESAGSFIAISRTVDLRHDSPVSSRIEVVYHNDVNVLWVEWKDGIAYRLGNGHIPVTATCWLAQSPEEIDIKLG
jgi:hypothetical protein